MIVPNVPVLEVENLRIAAGDLVAVRDVNLKVLAGGRLGIVGESGAGKSMTGLAIMGLLPNGWLATGAIRQYGVDLLGLGERALTSRRGKTMSMIFQDPSSSLNPTQRVGKQITSVLCRHTDLDRTAAQSRAHDLLSRMRLPRPTTILRSYPHQLSGGQCQRVMIAMALACYPGLIIADEPTTALDSTVQKEVLRVLDSTVREQGCALIMITHDLPVIASMCTEVAVMYAGRIVEHGPVAAVFTAPKHPYTAALLRAQPTMDNIRLTKAVRLPSIPGSVPSITDIPSGCAFRTRCQFATSVCETLPTTTDETHAVACWHPIPSETCGSVPSHAEGT